MMTQERIRDVFARRAVKPRIMSASYSSTCGWCLSPVRPGDEIGWCGGDLRLALHVDCLACVMSGPGASWPRRAS